MVLRTRDADAFLGDLKFSANCAGCHGVDGRAINFGEPAGEEEYVGTIARDNPWELANKILHGQPGSVPTMPTAAGKYYSFDDVADLIVYAQQLP
jgi:thiosulfate dehydrogenase